MNRIVTKVLVVVSVIFCTWYFASYGKESYPFYGDSMGYYMYLPCTFIYHNNDSIYALPQDKPFDAAIKGYLKTVRDAAKPTPTGHFIHKYTYGIAAMELPFFCIAHAYEKVTGGGATGYSASYRYLLKLSSLVYALLGIWMLYRILASFFDKHLSVAGTLVILMGTNLFWFTFHQPGMAHGPLFFLYGLLIYTTILIHRQTRVSLFAIAGFAAGLITIIRPTDIICLVIPLLYDVYSKVSLKQKMAMLKANYRGVVVFIVAVIVPVLPQMIYWKMFTGSFLYYSYEQETFNWLHPRVIEGLFSFTNGWLVYSPVMLFSLVGLVCFRQIRSLAWAIYIILPVYIYIVYSWHCFNYINGLGSRPMIHLYPLLAIPLTAFIKYLSQRRVYIKAIFLVLFLFCVSLNLSYCLQKARGILNSEESNAAYNLHTLFKMNADYNDMVLYDTEQLQPEGRSVERIAVLGCQDHEDSISDRHIPDPTGKSRYVYRMPDDAEYYPETVVVKVNKEQFKNAVWLKCSGMFYCPKAPGYFSHLLTVDVRRDNQSMLWKSCKIDRKIGLAEPGTDRRSITFDHFEKDKWGYVYYFVKIPEGIRDGDEIRMDVWNIGKQEILFDNLCLEIYRKK